MIPATETHAHQARTLIVRRYIANHWHGRQSLARSFWVNLVAVQIVLFIGLSRLDAPQGVGYLRHGVTAAILGSAGIAAVFIWQAVGTIRAGEAHIRAMGSMPAVWGTQLGLIIAFWLSLTEIHGVALIAQTPAPTEIHASLQARARAERYSFTTSDDGHDIRFAGSIEHGSTAALLAYIETAPAARRILLESPGGNIYEARGLARLVRDRGLGTRVIGTCSSACTTVFLAGATRDLGPAARLGFHSYRIDAGYPVPFADPQTEQARDAAVFADAGVKRWFLDRIAAQPASGLWYPSFAELERAGVVTTLLTD